MVFPAHLEPIPPGKALLSRQPGVRRIFLDNPAASLNGTRLIKKMTKRCALTHGQIGYGGRRDCRNGQITCRQRRLTHLVTPASPSNRNICSLVPALPFSINTIRMTAGKASYKAWRGSVLEPASLPHLFTLGQELTCPFTLHEPLFQDDLPHLIVPLPKLVSQSNRPVPGAAWSPVPAACIPGNCAA